MASILQGVDNLYEIDTTWKILDRAAELTEQKYGADHRTDVALRVVADHVRSAVMLVDDGVLPSNEARGYVLRRILRRSIRNLRTLSGGQRGGGGGMPSRRDAENQRYLHELTATAIGAMAPQFPELSADAAKIHAVIDAEEAAFAVTLRTGTAIFDAAVGEVKRRNATALGGVVGSGPAERGVAGSRLELSGDQAFQLHDTYGFPIDLTLEMASEQGLTVDEEGFRRLMAEQRRRAKDDSRAKKTGNADLSVLTALLERSGKVTFTGYEESSGEATVAGLLVNGAPVPAAGAGTEVEVVLDRTPFYAEGRPARGHRGHQDRGADRRRGQPDQGARRTGAGARPDRPPRSGDGGRGGGRGARLCGDRRRAAPRRVPLAYRYPPHPPRLPRRARRLGRAGRLGELAGPAAAGLHCLGRGAALGVAGRRGRSEHRAHRRPRGPGVHRAA